MTDRRTHLVERAAALLRTDAGLSDAALDAARPNAPPSRPPEHPLPAGDQQGTARASAGSRAAPIGVANKALVDLDTMLRAGLAVAGQQRSRTAEEFRVIVDRVLHGLEVSGKTPIPANLMLVTSAKPGEGKTFATLNIGASIAQNGLRDVLLVDIDAKRDSLTRELGLAEAPGLLDLVADPSLQLDDLLVATALKGLHFLPIGGGGLGGSGGGMTRPVVRMVEQIARRFSDRVVLLDCPPCLSSSDPIALAPLVNQIVLVVEADVTQQNEIDSCLHLVHSCPNVILMLNKMRRRTDATFGKYYYNYSGSE